MILSNKLVIPCIFSILSSTCAGFTTNTTRMLSKKSIISRAHTASKKIMAQSQSKSSLKNNFISSILEVSEYHDIFLLDMWGVMHNGSTPYDGVLETISKLKSLNKKLIILSNSSKRIDHAYKMLEKLGFNINDFDNVITSGEVSHRMLSGDKTLQCNTWPILDNLLMQDNDNKKVFVFGSGNDDEEYVTSSGWKLSSIHDANLLLARGTFTINDGNSIISKKDNENDYNTNLKKCLLIAAKKKIPMLISNPDKVRPDEGLPPMPGAIGDAYEDILKGAHDVSSEIIAKDIIKRIGKPYSEVYEIALHGVSSSSIPVMVGDALETDIIGGTANKCATVWCVKDGIHAASVDEVDSTYEVGVDTVLKKFNTEKKEFIQSISNSDELIPSFIVPHFKL